MRKLCLWQHVADVSSDHIAGCNFSTVAVGAVCDTDIDGAKLVWRSILVFGFSACVIRLDDFTGNIRSTNRVLDTDLLPAWNDFRTEFKAIGGGEAESFPATCSCDSFNRRIWDVQLYAVLPDARRGTETMESCSAAFTT